MKTYLEQLEQLDNWNACPKITSVLSLLPASPKSPFPLESLNSVYLSSLFPLMMRSSSAAPWQKSWKVKCSENCGRLKVG
jgi:hypothetical protein